MRAERLTQAAESTDHLVRDQQHVIPREHAVNLFPVPFRGRNQSTGSKHRLTDESRDSVRPLRLNEGFELRRALRRELALSHPRFRMPEEMWGDRVQDGAARQIERAMKCVQ